MLRTFKRLGWLRQVGWNRKHRGGGRKLMCAGASAVEQLESRQLLSVGFAPQVDYSLGALAKTVVTADFNGDGKTDIGTADWDGTISVMLNNGDGTFASRVDSPAPGIAGSLVAADFNGDGKADLAITDIFINSVYLLMGNGDGAFAAPVDYAAGMYPGWLKVGDFNGDGKVDLVAANAFDATASVLLNNGDGTFASATTSSVPGGFGSVNVADFDGNGVDDLLLVGSAGDSVLLNQGDGTFAAPVDFIIAGAEPLVIAADFNGDGRADLATNNSGGLVNVLMNNGDGTFASAVSYGGSRFMGLMTLADIDGDGRMDLAGLGLADGSLVALMNQGDGTFTITNGGVVGFGGWLTTAADFNGDGKADLVALSDRISVLQGNGDGTFAAKVDLAVAGLVPESIASADLNGDGTADLVTADAGSNLVSVLINNGDGTFAPKVDYGTGQTPKSVIAADLNGDGKFDLAVANRDGDTVSILLNNGDGTFAGTVDYPTGGGPTSVTWADFNGDGKADLAVANRDDNTVSVLLNHGNGTFSPKIDYATGRTPSSVVAGDFDGDGRIDLAVGSYYHEHGRPGDGVSMLFNQGNGVFVTDANYLITHGGHYLASASNLTSITTGDFDGDGTADLAMTSEYDNNVTIWFNNGNSLYGSLCPTGVHPQSVVSADFDGDGWMDMAVVSSDPKGLMVLHGNGAGTFTVAGTWTVGSEPSSVVAADFNGDGKVDLATANSGVTSVSVLINQGTVVPPNDNFADAIPIIGFPATVTGSNVGATRETWEFTSSYAAGASVWWTWTSPVSGWVQIDTVGSDFPMVVAVYTGTPVSGLAEVASGFWAGSGAVTFTATAGTTYCIAVDNSYLGDTGNILLNVGPSITPPQPPASVVASTSLADWIHITWDNSPGATAYQVWRATIDNWSYASPISPPEGVTDTSFDDTEPSPGVGYVYWVVASNSAGVSGFGVSAPGRRLPGFGADSADGDTIPCLSASSGTVRHYRGLGAFAGADYTQTVSTEQYLGITCLRIDDSAIGGNFGAARAASSRLIAKDINGQLWIMEWQDEHTSFTAASLAEAIPSPQSTSIWAFLMGGENTWGWNNTLAEDGWSQTIYQYGGLPLLPGYSFTGVEMTSPDGSQHRWQYYGSAGLMIELWNDNAASDGPGWILDGYQPDLSWKSLSVVGRTPVMIGGTLDLQPDYQVLNPWYGGSVTIEYHLSTNRVWGDRDDMLLGLVSSGVSGSETYFFPFLTVPTSAKPGVYHLLAKLDPANEVAESNENNNLIVGDQINVLGPANDALDTRQPIGGSLGTVLGNNTGATMQPKEPKHAGGRGGHSVWWTWVAPQSGSVRIDTQGSNFDTLLGVYTGKAVGALKRVAANNDRAAGVKTSQVVFNAKRGVAYQIAVDGNRGAVGNIVLNLKLSQVVVDDGQANFRPNSAWGLGNGGYRRTVRSTAGGAGQRTATWTFQNLEPGKYRVAATWVPMKNLASDAPYTILHGQQKLAMVLVNQQDDPGGLTLDGADWRYLGDSYQINGGTLVVRLSNKADGYVIADAVRIERV